MLNGDFEEVVTALGVLIAVLGCAVLVIFAACSGGSV